MKDVALPLRVVVLNELNTIQLGGVPIPFGDEDIAPGITIPNISGGRVYGLINNQFEINTTNNKCNFRETVVIQIEVVTKFPKGTGGKKLSEQVSNLIQLKLIPFASNAVSLNPTFQILTTKKGTSSSITESTQSETVFRKIIPIEFTIYQL